MRQSKPSKDTVSGSGAERFRPAFVKAVKFSLQSVVRSKRQGPVMRPNNETMLAEHAPHSTHCLKWPNSLNCLIKCVKTLQTANKRTIVFLLGSHKSSNLVCRDLSLTLNIIIIYNSFTEAVGFQLTLSGC